jgi:hypothetical protein
MSLPFLLPAIDGMTGAYHHTLLLLIEMGSPELSTQAGLETQSSQSPPPEKLR